MVERQATAWKERGRAGEQGGDLPRTGLLLPSPIRSDRRERGDGRPLAVTIGHPPAKPRAHPRRVVARIVDPALAVPLKHRLELARRCPEQGAEQPHAAGMADRRHAAEPSRSGSRKGAHQHGLSLVGPVVGKQEMERPGLGAGSLERRMPGRAKPRRARPGAWRQATDVRGETVSPGPGSCEARLGCGRRSHPMVEDQRDRLAPPRARPSAGKQSEGEAVGTAGQGDGEARGILPSARLRHRFGEAGGGALSSAAAAAHGRAPRAHRA